MKFIEKETQCPSCKSSWLGVPIPQEIQHHYGGAKHFIRSIGVEDGSIYDGTVAIKCPDCSEYFPRAKTKWAIEMYNKFMNKGVNNENS